MKKIFTQQDFIGEENEFNQIDVFEYAKKFTRKITSLVFDEKNLYIYSIDPFGMNGSNEKHVMFVIEEVTNICDFGIINRDICKIEVRYSGAPISFINNLSDTKDFIEIMFFCMENAPPSFRVIGKKLIITDEKVHNRLF